MIQIEAVKAGNATVLKVSGRLDNVTASQFDTACDKLLRDGALSLVLDFSNLTYISSAGLVALHSVALLSRGEELPDTEGGWSAYRSMGRSSEAGMQRHVKLLNPHSEVMGVLDMVGFGNVFQVYTNLDEAVNSF